MQVNRKVRAALAWIPKAGFRLFRRLCLIIGFIIFLGLVVAIIIGGSTGYYIFKNQENLPDLQPLVNFDVPQIGTIYDSKGKPVINLAKEYRMIIKPEEITSTIKSAFLSAEDKDFYAHDGVDWDALLIRAVGKNLESSVEASIRESSFQKIKLVPVIQQGASTITDQLVGLYYKNSINATADKLSKKWWIFLPKRYLRKMEELRLAVYLEKELAKPKYFSSKRKVKDEILARFLSYAYFRKVYGIKAASLYYFDKDVAHLDYGEAALLAGIIKNPSLFAPTSNPPNNFFIQRQLNRRNSILDLMKENGHLTIKQADAFKENELPVPKDKRNFTDAPSMVGDVLSELRSANIDSEKLFNGDISIQSTGDLRIQLIANQAFENGLREFESRHPEAEGIIQGSVVVLRNSDAAILAEIGGRGVYKEKIIRYTDFNRVRHSLRQPGSAFKPFVYLTAIKNGWTLESQIRDAPIAVPMGWIKIKDKWVKRPPKWIQNYDGKFKGFIPLRKALAESRNAPTIRLTRIIGIEDVLEMAYLLGIKTKLEPYITTAIGASEVNLLELANAYRVISSEIYAEPYSIAKVVNKNGEIVFVKKSKTALVEIDHLTLAQIQEGLRGIVRIPGGTAHSLDNTPHQSVPLTANGRGGIGAGQASFPIPVMGKTGTTNNFRDALFVGSTYGIDGITVAVRVGFDDNRELGDKETGGRTALPIFKEIMLNIYKNNLTGPIPQFPEEIEKNIDNYLHNPQ